MISRAINRLVKARGKAAIVIDHDLQVIDAISDQLMVFTGTPARSGASTAPLQKEVGMNTFLKEVGLTYRRDVNSGRPRVNKPGSKLDREQKSRGEYYYVAAQEKEESAETD